MLALLQRTIKFVTFTKFSFLKGYAIQGKSITWPREFHLKFHLKNRYRTHRFAIRAISVFRVKFNVEFTSQVMDFPIKLNDFWSSLWFEIWQDQQAGVIGHENEKKNERKSII